MSPMSPVSVTVVLSFPRVSGDEPLPDGALYFLATFSPRERG